MAKKLVLNIVGALLLGSVWAGGIGVVDTKSILEHSARMKAETQQLKAKFSERGKQLSASRKSLMAEIKSLRKNQSVLSKKQYQKSEQKILKREKALAQKQLAFSREVMQAQQKVMLSVRKKLSLTARTIAKRSNLSVVLSTNGRVLYAAPSSDLTKKFQKKFK